MKRASPLGQGGTSGGFGCNSPPGVGLLIGEPTPALGATPPSEWIFEGVFVIPARAALGRNDDDGG